jgi:hypothetical protein
MWHEFILRLFLAALTISVGSSQATADRIVLPIEVLGVDATTVSQTVTLTVSQSESVSLLWLQVHGLRYAEQASVQINSSPWIPLTNETATVAEPGKTFGGIGGGFATLVLTVPLPNGTVIPGANTMRFRFNGTDALASSYRVLAWNFSTSAGRKVLPPETFVEDTPETWSPPLPDAASVEAGQKLWYTASLVASSLPKSPRIQAHCTDCHARDGRDLKYFNYSNASIVVRSRFHGLTTLQGEQIASYIRSLSLPHPGRPWNPPYQPGPGVDEQPISSWAAGAGLAWVTNRDSDALPYLIGQNRSRLSTAAEHAPGTVLNLHELAGEITADDFRPDGNLNPREIPVAVQLPDWNQWLPRIHPKDAWGTAFAQSEFAAMYDGRAAQGTESNVSSKQSLRALLATAQTPDSNLRPAIPAFARWSKARRAFLRRYVNGKTVWSKEWTNRVYSTQLWQMVKTWEMMQEFGLEGRGRDLFGSTGESRTWCNSMPEDTAPSAAHIPNGPVGVGGSALINEYLTASWYELQIILNSGNHQHQDRSPVDWVYLIHQFHDLYDQSHEPEPVRLLVAVTKALQSTDPHLGPDNYSQGWRPDQNVDPRIMVSPEWAPIFKPLPNELRRALAESTLAAWMDKNQQYPITKYLSRPAPPHDYSARDSFRDISGGNVWQATEEFRAAGVSQDLVERLENWGLAYTDRAARLQYH